MSVYFAATLLTHFHAETAGEQLLSVCHKLSFSPSPTRQTKRGAGSSYTWEQKHTAQSDKKKEGNVKALLVSQAPRVIANPRGQEQAYPEKIDLARLADVTTTSHLHAVHRELSENGVAVVSLGFEDSDSQYLTQLVINLGRKYGHGPPSEHNSSAGWLWDVRPNSFNKRAAALPASQPHDSLTPPDRKKVARSETMEEFPWHTDCSWEPPQFFGLHVLQADRCGGGATSLLALDEILAMCTPDTIQALSQSEFAFAVPEEFREASGETHVTGAILWNGPSWRIRFRADTTKALTSRAESALKELTKILENETRLKDVRPDSGEQGRALVCKPSYLTNGSVILVDNTRWLHSRNHVADPGRHLRRIRWSTLSVT